MQLSSTRRPVSIRRSLLVDLVVLLALTGGTILLVTWFWGMNTVEGLSRLLIDRPTARTVDELDRFFATVRSTVLITRDWAEAGTLDPTDYDTLNTLFVPFLQQYPQMSSMMVATSKGQEYLLLRDPIDPDTWTNRIVQADLWGTKVYNRRWSTRTGELEEGFGELVYDPRTRIWYERALETTKQDDVFWTKPVIFFVTKDPGVTASTHYDAPGGLTYVLAFDLLLMDISKFTTAMPVSEHGSAFVLVGDSQADDFRVVGLPRDERYDGDAAIRDALLFVPPDRAVVDSDAELAPPDEVGGPEIGDAARSWRDQGRPSGSFEFASSGENWWGGLQPYELGDNTFWIGVVVPERDLLGAVRLQQLALLGLVLAVLVVGVVRARVLARRFSAPVEALVRESERIRRGDLEPGPGIRSNVTEIRRLAEAHETMREGLEATMKLEKVERDLEIAHQIQQGLLPGDVPQIPGLEIAGWNKAAEETGGDYYDWLELPDGRLVWTLADVTGHGIGPAIIVAVCRAYMRASTTAADVDLAEALTRVNDLLHADIPEQRFVTAAVGIVDAEQGRMAMVSAGQAPILFYEAATGTVHNWDAHDLPLGVAGGLVFEAPQLIDLNQGDVLVLTTDGFFEWANADGELYGTKRMVAFLRDHHHLPASEFISTLHEAVLAHAAGTPQADDLTAVVIRKV